MDYLRLDVRDLAPAELKLVERDVGLAKVAQEAEFFRPEDEEGVSLAALTASRSTYPVNVLLGVIWRIELKMKRGRKLISTLKL